jgi:AraC-like DNA-binding protein
MKLSVKIALAATIIIGFIWVLLLAIPGLLSFIYVHQGVVVVCILLILFLAYHLSMRRKIKLKNRVLFHYINKQVKDDAKREADRMRMSRSMEMPQEIHTADVSTNESGDKQVFNRLRDLIEKEQLYKDPLLGRDMLTERLHVSRNTLANVIKNYSDSRNLSDFINNYRLEYAVHLLITQKDIPVSEVAEQSGFNSRNSFGDNFKRVYSMSPTQYRKAADQSKI